MDRLRLAMVTPRFWPMLGGEETIAGLLAAGLVERGCRVSVATVGWKARWPPAITWRGAEIVRLGPPPVGLWHQALYANRLARWLRRRGAFDVVYWFGLDASAAVSLWTPGGPPRVFRITQTGATGDVARLHETWPGRMLLRRARRRAWFVTSSAEGHRELVDAGVAPGRIRPIPVGVAQGPARSLQTRYAARAVLAAAQAIFTLPAGATLLVCCSRLAEGRGLTTLIEAMTTIASRRGNVRLWLVGDGPESMNLKRQINQRGQTNRILLTSAFEGCDEVLAAADVAILPSALPDTGMALLEAMAAGLPIVAVDVPHRRQRIAHGIEALLVPPEDPTALTAAIERILGDPSLAASLAAAARRRADRESSLAEMVDGHLTWLSTIAGSPAASHPCTMGHKM